MKLLDIIVTHYKEDWSVGKKLFDMIGLQRCVDFNQIKVIIVNDGGNMIPEDCLSGYPYKIKQLNIDHGGVSAARNAGIAYAKSKWIMFCDFDDSFASIFSLREYMNVLQTEDKDMLWSAIVAEDYIDGKQLLYFVPDKQRFVFCHGKVYRLDFLRTANVQFDTELVFNEDSCFNAVIIARTSYERIGEIKSTFPLYVWVRREHSVTNSGRVDEASYGHFKRNLKVTAEYENGDDRYEGMVTRTAYDTYFMVFGKRNSMQMRRRIVDEFAPWISERLNVFGNVSQDVLEEIRKVSRSELIEPDELVPDSYADVSKWVKCIAQIYTKAR